MTEKIRLENDLFLREIVYGEGGIYTSSIYNKVTNREYNKRLEVGEFQLNVNGDQIRSYSKPEVHVLDGSVVDVKQMLETDGYEFTAGAKGSQVLKISCAVKNTILFYAYVMKFTLTWRDAVNGWKLTVLEKIFMLEKCSLNS